MKVFLAAVVLVGLCVLGMCIGVLFRRGFPKYDVGSNPEMAARGIRCFKDEDAALHRRLRRGLPAGCSGNFSDACKDCGLYPGTVIPGPDRESLKKE